EGTPQELRRQLAGRPVVRAAFRGQVSAGAAVRGIPGVASVDETAGDGETRVRIECESDANVPEEVFHLAVSKGWVLRELSRDLVSLEDVFVRLTRHDEAAEGESPAALEAEASDAGRVDA
ncbi:MAG TPA: DUF4162 domain-containing protein, partial [Thermoanaerobaculia bacterium]